MKKANEKARGLLRCFASEPPRAIRGATSHDERDGQGFGIRLDSVQAPALSTFGLSRLLTMKTTPGERNPKNNARGGQSADAGSGR
jgi:hypothetical protein